MYLLNNDVLSISENASISVTSGFPQEVYVSDIITKSL